MRPLANTAGERIVNKGRFEDFAQNSKHGMVHHSISYGGLMNVAQLRIRNVKARIRTVPVHFLFEIVMELKDMLLQIAFKQQDIRLAAFAFPKFLPRREQSFWGNNCFEETAIPFHCP